MGIVARVAPLSYTPNSTTSSDGCHPNPAGAQKMADKRYAGLLAKGMP
jgi:lysophospholipase L1-like esterase